jgi:ParB family chromosome partitioning protein
VTKARILEAVREAKGDGAAQLIDHLKKPDMAREAERLLAGTGWLPEPLRTPDADLEPEGCAGSKTDDLPAFLTEGSDVAASAETGSMAAE